MANVNPGRHTREAAIRSEAYDGEKRELGLSFASELPVRRYYGIEVLSCRSGDVDLSRLLDGAPLLLQHDASEQIGVVLGAEIGADRVCRATCRISRNETGEEVARDIVDGIRTKASVGYETTEAISDEINAEGVRVITWRWKPYEISLVSVPADSTVGVGRSAGGCEEKQKMSEGAVKPAIEPQAEKPTVEVANEIETVRKAAKEIVALARSHKADVLADKALAEGWTLDQFRAELLRDIASRQPAATKPAAEIGMSRDEIKQYSILRAIRSFLPGDKTDAGFEMECSQQVARQLGKDPRSFFVPYDVQRAGRRDLTVAGTGSNAVQTTIPQGSFIEMLRNAMVLNRLGVTMLTGLQGNLSIPKQTGAATGYWVAEGVAPTESTQVLTALTASPKTVGANSDITRNMVYQSSIDAEAMVRNDLAEVLARSVDYACFNDAGAGAPSYLLGISGINNPSISSAGAATYAEILSFASNIAADNVPTDGASWVTTNEVFYNLCGIPRHATASAAGFIADVDNSTIIGRPAIQSESLPANTAVFGVWKHLILCMWGNGLDLLVDPFTQSKAVIIQVRAFMDVDFIVRHPQAFAYNSAVTA